MNAPLKNNQKDRQTEEDSESDNLKRPLIISVIIHVCILLFLIIGMPHISTRDFDVPPPVMIELAPIAETAMTDKAPVKAPDVEEPKEELPPPVEEKPKEQPAKSVPEKKPEPKPDLIPEPEPEPEPEVTEEDTSDAFDSILKNLADNESANKVNDSVDVSEDTLPQPTPDAPLGDRVTMTELDALRFQLMQCWNIPAGAQGAEDLKIEVRINVNPDRTVQNVEIIDQGRYQRDSFFRAAADSARRAVVNPSCSPLKLPPEKYDQWKTTVIVFDPSDMF